MRYRFTPTRRRMTLLSTNSKDLGGLHAVAPSDEDETSSDVNDWLASC